MCEAEDRLEEVENELDRLKEQFNGVDGDDFTMAAREFKRFAFTCSDQETKSKLLFLAECFERLGLERELNRRFSRLAEQILCCRV